MTQPTVADMGELGLLARLQTFCASTLVGDDAAVLPSTGGDAWVVTTDVLVDGVHFSDRTTAPEDVGWRAVAANLSDLAAMGATPVGITVGLSLPGVVPVAWVEAVYRGMVACLKIYGGDILGGDVVRSPHISLAITAIGQVAPEQVITRDRAQPGQVIVATGYHGASRAGLEILLNPDSGKSLSTETRAALIQAHQRPRPRLDVVDWLRSHLTATEFLAIAGMDSSDGLANAVLHLCQASQVGARLVRSHLPAPPSFAPWLAAETALDWTLYGGEDFELVLCLPAEIGLALVADLGSEAAIVGTVEPDPTVWLVDTPMDTMGMPLSWQSGFQHFSD